MYARRSVNIAEKWALVADGGHGNDAPLADYAGRAGERGLGRCHWMDAIIGHGQSRMGL